MVLATGDARGATIVTDATITDSVPGLTGFATNGDLMDGLAITATFVSGFTETRALAGLGGGNGSAVGTNWSVLVNGDTFGVNAWTVNHSTGSALASLILDGIPGLTVFDRTFGGVEGTPGSANGRDFLSNLAQDASITATYSRQVAIGVNPPVGDIWHLLSINFGQLTGGGVTSGTNFMFSQDTDNDSRRIPPPSVPEPATLTLLGLGLLGAGFRRLRR
jgi:hypothetical protein